MPTYDYVCRACGHRIEVHHGLYADGPTQCPNCHSHALRKAIAAPAVVFKGSGWAKKDRGRSSRSKAAADTAGGDGGHESTSGGGDSPKDDSPKDDSPTGDSPTGDSAKGATGGAEPAASPTASGGSGGSDGSAPAPGVD